MTETEKYIIENYCKDLTYYENGAGFFGVLSDSFKSAFQPAIGSLCLIVCLIVAAAAVKALSDSVLTDSAPFTLCMTLVCSGVILASVKTAYDAAKVCLTGIDALMDSMIAVMCALYGLSGSIVGGSAAVTVLMAVMQAVRLVCTKLLLPLITVCLGCSLLSGLGFNTGLKGAANAVRRAVVFLCAASGTVICFALAYQTVIVKTADGAALRTLKFGASSFIPIIGASLSESLSSVISAISAVRAYAGLGGILSILALTVPPVVIIITCRLALKAGSLLSSTLGLEYTAPLFEDGCSLLSVLLAVVITVSAVFCIACGLFAL